MATVGGRLRHVGEALAAEPSTAPLRLDVQVFEKGPVCPEAVENGPAAPERAARRGVLATWVPAWQAFWLTGDHGLRGGPIRGVAIGGASPMNTTISYPPGLPFGSIVILKLFATHTLPDRSIWTPVLRVSPSNL